MRTLSSRTGLTKGTLLICFLIVFIAGCATKESKKPKTVNQVKKWQALADRASAITPIPSYNEQNDESVLEDMEEPIKPDKVALDDNTVLSRQLPTMPITMNMNDVSLPVLIRSLAKAAELDIIINESVKGQTQVLVTNVRWDQLFLGLLDTFGITYEWSGNILRVLSVEDLKKKQTLLEARQNYENTKNRHGMALMQLKQKKKQMEPLVTKIVKIHYSDLQSLQENLTKYLSENRKQPSESSRAPTAPSPQSMLTNHAAKAPEDMGTNGAIMIDESSNSLIIHASRGDVKKIMAVVRQLDRPMKQVLIEAHIVEAESNTGKELGIQWGGLSTSKRSSGKSISIGGGISEFATTFQDEDGNDVAYQPVDGNIVDLPISASTGLSLGFMAQKLGEYVLYAQLLALEEEGLLNILSKPSITTMDNHKATIKSGKEVPFQTVENDEINIEWKEAVIKLEVTPHVINNNIVRLEILTHKDELDFTNPVNGNPTIITKTAETTVTLFDGQTTVIGGLNKEKSNDAEKGIPGLRNTPGLGWLFKNVNKGEEMEELLIFITPHILKNQMSPPLLQE